MRLLNIGAGRNWYREGWEIVDSTPGSYPEPWMNHGFAWDTKLPDESFDGLYSCHMLEHIPQFRLEKTIAEFGRILKTGGRVRIVVPDLRRAVKAYFDNDKKYFTYSKHYSDHLGIGGSLLSVILSPGKQTIAVNNDFSEIMGGYAHVYSFDFEMLKILLEKWGFDDVVEAKYRESELPNIEELPAVVCDGKSYSFDDPFITSKDYKKSGKKWFNTGFDKAPDISLIVEAVKVRNEPYSFDKEFFYHKRGRIDDKSWRLKLALFRPIATMVDNLFLFIGKLRS